MLHTATQSLSPEIALKKRQPRGGGPGLPKSPSRRPRSPPAQPLCSVKNRVTVPSTPCVPQTHPPWAGLRSGRPLSPAAFAWPVPPRWAGGFGRHPSKPRPRRPVLRDMERDSHGRGPEASPVDGPTASTSEWPGPLHRASAPGGHAGAERAPPGPAVQAGGFQAETRAPGGAPAHSAGLPAPASARDLAPFTLICLICRARPTPF